jgi:hypothetical protein
VAGLTEETVVANCKVENQNTCGESGIKNKTLQSSDSNVISLETPYTFLYIDKYIPTKIKSLR